MLEWKFQKLIHDNADKGRIKLSGKDRDTPLYLQNKNPCGTPLHGRMRGSIRNLKAVEKNHPQPQNRKKNSTRTGNRMQNSQNR